MARTLRCECGRCNVCRNREQYRKRGLKTPEQRSAASRAGGIARASQMRRDANGRAVA